MGPTVVDLFAGCGGLGLGLEQAGFATIFVNELHQDALDTYLINRVDSSLKERQNHSNDILELTQNPAELQALADRLHREHGDIDLVSGGPPCQGFSTVGHRRSFIVSKQEIPSNHLYREMAKVVQALAPKAFLFENVRGLLTGKWSRGGDQGEIWVDVQETFRRLWVRRKGVDLFYRLESRVVAAKDYGVPQNRPRVLLVGLRSDIDSMGSNSTMLGGLIPGPTGSPPDPHDFLGDLVDPNWAPGGSTRIYPASVRTDTQRYFRTTPDGRLMAKGSVLAEHDYSRHSPDTLAKFRFMLDHGGRIPDSMKTKKFAQRVLPDTWGPGGPNITATSLPDDYVHFSQPRVPTVREWARIQTFPDWYQFAGYRTTGGRRRAGDPSAGKWTRELPKYTQIGNAVPVQMGREIGRHLFKIVAGA